MHGMENSFGLARRLVLVAMLSAIALPVLPQGAGGYTVEIIVFRNGGDGGALDEAQARLTIPGDDVAATLVSSRKLGDSISRLNSAGLRVLGHAAWKQNAAAWQSRRGVSASRLNLPGITGKVIVERGELLHLGVDLVVEDGGKRYRVNEVRPVKTDEIRYFDHPAIGVIATISTN
jgi:hypothetical protein